MHGVLPLITLVYLPVKEDRMSIPQLPLVVKGLTTGQHRFLYGLDCTPDERLRWSPAEATKSPCDVAGALIQFLNLVAHMLAHREMPGRGRPFPPAPTTREEAREGIDAASAAVRRAVEALEPEDLGQAVAAPWGESTVEEVLWLINGVILYHQGQLNYIQLCYGDTNPNIPSYPGGG